MDAKNYDVAIVGGGAAGLGAALTLGRALRRVVVIDSGAPRNAPASHVHGYLTRDGMPPGELLEAGRAEVRDYGGEIVAGTVREATATDGGFALTLADGRSLTARRLLVTTGLTDELPALPGLAERWGNDVIHCPYCHGYEVRGTPLGVLATGPMSVHQALLVSQWSSDVVFFEHTLADLSGDDRERLAARGVRVVAGTVARLRVEDDRLVGVELADGDVVARAALFLAPRFVANDGLLAALGAETESSMLGEWVKTDPTGKTSVPGVWAAGNVSTPMAQVIHAAGAGVFAGAAINMDLVEADIARALAERRVEEAAVR